MPEYHIIWDIKLTADTPQEAAALALALMIHRDPASLATVFTVIDEERGTAYSINPLEEQKGRN